jgi:hypothetical protein
LSETSLPSGTPEHGLRSLARLSIRKRLFIGFGILILSGATLGAFAIIQLHMIGADVGRSVALTGNTNRVNDVARRFEVMRKDALSNAKTGDASAVTSFVENATRVLAVLDEAGKATLSEARRKTYAGAAANVGKLSAAFDQLGKLTAGAEDIRKTLFSVGDDVTAATVALIKAARAGDDQKF